MLKYIGIKFKIMEILTYFILAFISGFIGKLTDSFNEHGLKPFFIGAGWVFSIIWGLIVGYLITVSPIVYISYLALTFFTIFKLKFDYHDHALSLIIIIIFAIKNHYNFIVLDTIVLTLIYIIFYYLKDLKLNILQKFFKYKLQFLVVVLLYFIYTKNVMSFVVLFNFFGSLSVNYFFKLKN